MNELLRNIPQISSIIEEKNFIEKYSKYNPDIVIKLIRETFDSIRKDIVDGIIISNDMLGNILRTRLEKKLAVLEHRSLVQVVNATGIVLHTNLGRAVMKHNQYLPNILEGYCNLEFDLSTGKRGKRGVHLRNLIHLLLGAPSTVVVNNNAAAILLLLKTHADGKEVIVSRGELIELGGSFRLPEVMAASGAILCEVGTTNRTHLHDYTNAINDRTAMILKVHPSNYAIRGFTTAPSVAELAKLSSEKGIPFVYDVGSGLLRKINHPNFKDEPDCQSALDDGADAILFSGDKIMCGTQAGFIVGSEKIAGACGKIPLMRSLRLAKAHMCMLEETLRLWLAPNEIVLKTNPVIRMISMSYDELHMKAKMLADAINASNYKVSAKTVKVSGYMGGGSLPDIRFDSCAVTLETGDKSEEILVKLRSYQTPVIARIDEDCILLDVRTILPGEEETVLKAVLCAYE